MISIHSCVTHDEPCITRCVLGNRAWISLTRSITKTSPVGRWLNLYAPWLVPIAIARASTPVSNTNRTASSGSSIVALGLPRLGGAVPILLLASEALDRPEHPDLALDRHAHDM